MRVPERLVSILRFLRSNPERMRRRYERERKARLQAEAIAERCIRAAAHDPLTGLPNRALFMERLDHVLTGRARKRGSFGVLLLDLDGFKEINDSLGHAAGDELLCAVAKRLTEAVQSFDTVARLGGDEFAILIKNAAGAGHSEIAQRITAALAEPIVLQGQRRSISASLGMVVCRGVDTPRELLRKADVAMYSARRQGKSRCAVFETGMYTAMAERLQMKSDLQRALDHGEFVVHYQPIVELPRHRLASIEALVRWTRPGGGCIHPNEFIPLAEETGLIAPLGWWVLETSCRQFHQWRQAHSAGADLTLSVNFSAQQLHDSQAAARVLHVLNEAQLPPECVVLELTESGVMKDIESSLIALRKLTALGVRLAIDDFGAGYSSLGYVQKLPATVLKIDKSLVDRVADGVEGAALVQAVVSFCSALGLKVIAEGVEREAQALRLQSLGCSYAQGHYFSRPLDPTAMDIWLRNAGRPIRTDKRLCEAAAADPQS